MSTNRLLLTYVLPMKNFAVNLFKKLFTKLVVELGRRNQQRMKFVQ